MVVMLHGRLVTYAITSSLECCLTLFRAYFRYLYALGNSDRTFLLSVFLRKSRCTVVRRLDGLTIRHNFISTLFCLMSHLFSSSSFLSLLFICLFFLPSSSPFLLASLRCVYALMQTLRCFGLNSVKLLALADSNFFVTNEPFLKMSLKVGSDCGRRQSLINSTKYTSDKFRLCTKSLLLNE